jgi:hypothetical protein
MYLGRGEMHAALGARACVLQNRPEVPAAFPLAEHFSHDVLRRYGGLFADREGKEKL